MLVARRHIVLLVALAALFVPAKAQAGGGAYVFSGGSEAARAQVRAALEASSFDWGLVPATVTIRIADCGCAGSRPGLIVLDEELLSSAPYGRAYTWAIVQHEYAHQVWDLALDDGARALLRARLGGADLCYEQPGLPHDAHACERFADTLAWAYWPVPDNPSRWSRAMGARRFRALMADLLGERAWVNLPRSAGRTHGATS
jgi:hypothetical protein